MRSKMTSAANGAGAQTNIRASGFIDNASRTACAIVNVLPVPGGPKHTSGATVRSFILLFALFALFVYYCEINFFKMVYGAFCAEF